MRRAMMAAGAGGGGATQLRGEPIAARMWLDGNVLDLPPSVAGDLLIICIVSSVTLATPSGWTRRVLQSVTNLHLYCFTKVSAGETTVTFTGFYGIAYAYNCAVVEGSYNATTPVTVVASATINPPLVTALGPTSLWIAFSGAKTSATSGTVSSFPLPAYPLNVGAEQQPAGGCCSLTETTSLDPLAFVYADTTTSGSRTALTLAVNPPV